jgi:hypothetical protein
MDDILIITVFIVCGLLIVAAATYAMYYVTKNKINIIKILKERDGGDEDDQ